MENSLKKNMLFNSVGNTIYLVCQWLITIIIVRISGYQTAGIFTLTITVTNIFYAVSSMSIRNYQVSDIKNEYTNEQYIRARIIACCISLILCIGFSVFVADTKEKLYCIIIYMFFKITESIIDVYHGIDQKNGRMDIIGVSMAIRGIATITLFSISLYTTNNLLIAIFSMTSISIFVLFFYDISKTKNIDKNYLMVEKNKTKSLFIIAIPLITYTGLLNLIPSIPRFVLEYKFDSEILGIYASIATPAIIMQVSASFIFIPLMTPLAKAYYDNDKKIFNSIIKKTMFGIMILAVIFIVGAYFFTDLGLSILFGESILEYSYLFIPVLISSLLLSVSWFFGSVLTVLRVFKEIVIISMFSVILCFLLSLYFIPIYNMAGVNYSIIITFILNAIAQYIILIKRGL